MRGSEARLILRISRSTRADFSSFSRCRFSRRRWTVSSSRAARACSARPSSRSGAVAARRLQEPQRLHAETACRRPGRSSGTRTDRRAAASPRRSSAARRSPGTPRATDRRPAAAGSSTRSSAPARSIGAPSAIASVIDDPSRYSRSSACGFGRPLVDQLREVPDVPERRPRSTATAAICVGLDVVDAGPGRAARARNTRRPPASSARARR